MTGASAPYELGDVLGDKYRLESVLGKGGMGVVYRAENVSIGRKVAIKVLHPEIAQREDLLARFRQEARASAKIGHPGIIDVLDLGTAADGSAFLVMELLSGKSLADQLESERRPLPADKACELVAAVLDALEAAHQAGIIHRDLKPDNIYLCDDGAVKILDFGISKLRSEDDVSMTATGQLMGTPLYMAPEQAMGKKDIGPAADIYSMGALLYQALAGALPYTGQTFGEVIAHALNTTPRPLHELCPWVPEPLSTLVARMLAKSPAERPHSAADVAKALRAIDFASEPPMPSPDWALDETMGADVARPAAARKTDPAPPKNKRTALLLGAGATLAAAILGIAVAVGGKDANDRTSPDAASSETAATYAIDAAQQATPDAREVPSASVHVDATPADPTVKVELSATPKAARWWLDDRPLECNPCTIERPRGTSGRAEARAAGFANEGLDLTFEESGFRSVRLKPHAPRPARRRDAGVAPGVTLPPNPLRDGR